MSKKTLEERFEDYHDIIIIKTPIAEKDEWCSLSDEQILAFIVEERKQWEIELAQPYGHIAKKVKGFELIIERERKEAYHEGWLKGMREGKQIGYLRRKQIEKSVEAK